MPPVDSPSGSPDALTSDHLGRIGFAIEAARAQGWLPLRIDEAEAMLRAARERDEQSTWAEHLRGQLCRLPDPPGDIDEDGTARVSHALSLISTVAAALSRAEAAEQQAAMWQRIRKPTHGPCCTCQRCGENYDDCRCDLDETADEVARLREDVKALAEAVALEHGSNETSDCAICAALARPGIVEVLR